MKKEITYILAGGCGIGIGMALKNACRTTPNKAAEFIAMDTSDANEETVGGLFPVELLPNARGSGKVRGLNFAEAERFVQEFFTKHKPTDFNVIVCSSAGGSGSMLAQVAYCYLRRNAHNAIMAFVNDHTSQVEMENAVNTKRGFAAQTGEKFLNSPVVYLEVSNTKEFTRGQVNEQMVQQLDYLSLFLTTNNEEVDYQDIVHLLDYSKHFKVPASMSKINFYDDKTSREYKGKPPVAVCSLFENRDDVIPVFEGCVYRATGVYNIANNPPKGVKEMHMALDHGEAVELVKTQITEIDDRKVINSGKFVKDEDLGVGASNGGFYL